MQPPPFQRLSTAVVPPAKRLDYWVDVLSEAIVPMSLKSREPRRFEADILVAPVGPMAVRHQSGTAHSCLNSPRDLPRSKGRVFNLMMSLNVPWSMAHRGRSSLKPGDILLFDSLHTFDIRLDLPFDFINVELQPDWLLNWGLQIEELVGRRIPGDTGWGQTLSSFVRQLTPEFVARAPLPPSVLADQLAALLALIAGERAGDVSRPTPAQRSIADRIHDRISQRCSDPQLEAANVATSLNISVRTLHRALARNRQTFGVQLMSARVKAAARMLQSKSFDRLTTAEIGRRAGFTDASHFTRTFRAHMGITPLSSRKSRDVPEPRRG